MDWKIFFVIITKLIPRKNFFCIAKILVLMVSLLLGFFLLSFPKFGGYPPEKQGTSQKEKGKKIPKSNERGIRVRPQDLERRELGPYRFRRF